MTKEELGTYTLESSLEHREAVTSSYDSTHYILIHEKLKQLHSFQLIGWFGQQFITVYR